MCQFVFVSPEETEHQTLQENWLNMAVPMPNNSVVQGRAAQCIDKEILISKNGKIDIDIEIDKRIFW